MDGINLVFLIYDDWHRMHYKSMENREMHEYFKEFFLGNTVH